MTVGLGSGLAVMLFFALPSASFVVLRFVPPMMDATGTTGNVEKVVSVSLLNRGAMVSRGPLILDQKHRTDHTAPPYRPSVLEATGLRTSTGPRTRNTMPT